MSIWVVGQQRRTGTGVGGIIFGTWMIFFRWNELKFARYFLLHIRPISEFPSQTSALLLLSLHNVCHVTIAHCNDSNGFEFDVTIAMWRTESKVESVTIALWQAWVELSLHVMDISTVDKLRFESPKTWNYPTLNGTWLHMRQRYNVPDKEIDVFLSQ